MVENLHSHTRVLHKKFFYFIFAEMINNAEKLRWLPTFLFSVRATQSFSEFFTLQSETVANVLMFLKLMFIVTKVSLHLNSFRGNNRMPTTFMNNKKFK